MYYTCVSNIGLINNRADRHSKYCLLVQCEVFLFSWRRRHALFSTPNLDFFMRSVLLRVHKLKLDECLTEQATYENHTYERVSYIDCNKKYDKLYYLQYIKELMLI